MKGYFKEPVICNTFDVNKYIVYKCLIFLLHVDPLRSRRNTWNIQAEIVFSTMHSRLLCVRGRMIFYVKFNYPLRETSSVSYSSGKATEAFYSSRRSWLSRPSTSSRNSAGVSRQLVEWYFRMCSEQGSMNYKNNTGLSDTVYRSRIAFSFVFNEIVFYRSYLINVEKCWIVIHNFI